MKQSYVSLEGLNISKEVLQVYVFEQISSILWENLKTSLSDQVRLKFKSC